MAKSPSNYSIVYDPSFDNYAIMEVTAGIGRYIVEDVSHAKAEALLEEFFADYDATDEVRWPKGIGEKTNPGFK